MVYRCGCARVNRYYFSTAGLQAFGFGFKNKRAGRFACLNDHLRFPIKQASLPGSVCYVFIGFMTAGITIAHANDLSVAFE